MRFNPATESTVRTIESLADEVRDCLLSLPPRSNDHYYVWDCQDGRGWVSSPDHAELAIA